MCLYWQGVVESSVLVVHAVVRVDGVVVVVVATDGVRIMCGFGLEIQPWIFEEQLVLALEYMVVVGDSDLSSGNEMSDVGDCVVIKRFDGLAWHEEALLLRFECEEFDLETVPCEVRIGAALDTSTVVAVVVFGAAVFGVGACGIEDFDVAALGVVMLVIGVLATGACVVGRLRVLIVCVLLELW